MKKLVLILSAALLALCFAGCGAKDNGVAGTIDSAGNLSIFVPDGYTMVPGGPFGVPEGDENSIGLLPTDSEDTLSDYVQVYLQTETEAKAGVELTKTLNDAKEVKKTVGNSEWTGCEYTANDVTYLSLWAPYEDKGLQVNMGGHELDDSFTYAVLDSLVNPLPSE